jgi:crotonobetainyl-CoA:carnitine CoA-transferase CaiB-like acyl-CoA transferase
MTAILRGIRILEVAEHTFVPAASALLADWGADVIKIEHVERGDAMRGLASHGTAPIPNDVNVLFEHSNRGKRSLALDLTAPEGLEIAYRLAATADVFLTNKLPGVRKKLHIDLDHIRSHNPNIIYVRGTGQGSDGPDADRGAYDFLAFWSRAGVAYGLTRPEYGHVPLPGPGFGDSIGAMTIAGGIMGALYHRERTGEATVVDVSLLGTGMWAMGQALSMSLMLGEPLGPTPTTGSGRNPLVGCYLTKDGRWLALCCLQAGQYWPPFTEAIGRPELAADPRFADHASLMDNCDEAIAILREVAAQRTVDEWRECLADFVGQWTVVQHLLEVAADPQSVANGYVQDCQTAGGADYQLATAPVQYDGNAPRVRRGPEFNEHGDEILAELGLDWDTVVDLKVRGVVA